MQARYKSRISILRRMISKLNIPTVFFERRTIRTFYWSLIRQCHNLSPCCDTMPRNINNSNSNITFTFIDYYTINSIIRTNVFEWYIIRFPLRFSGINYYVCISNYGKVYSAEFHSYRLHPCRFLNSQNGRLINRKNPGYSKFWITRCIRLW